MPYNYASARKNNAHLNMDSGRPVSLYSRYYSKLRRSIPTIQNNPSAEGLPFDKNDETVTINVSGFRYETRMSTLSRFPQTLLGDPARRFFYFDSIKKEYFFERSRKTFSSILEFYQTNGILRRPEKIPLYIFVAEMLFYDLGENVLRKLLAAEEMLEDAVIVPSHPLQKKVWELFEVPTSSRSASVLAGFNAFIVFVAISNFCVQTLPRFQSHVLLENATFPADANEDDRGENPYVLCSFIIETLCNLWFCIELLVRFFVSPVKKTFFRQFMNMVDVFSIIPYFIDLAVEMSAYGYTKPGKMSSLVIFRVLRLLRIFRVFKLSRYSDGLQILWLTMKSARQELGVVFLLIAIGMTLFSAAVYFAELGQLDTDFGSIPGAFWWAVITWTAVGYGDMVPKHPAGKAVGAICSVWGVVCLAFIVPVVVAHFEHYFHRGKELEKLREVLAEAGCSSMFKRPAGNGPTSLTSPGKTQQGELPNKSIDHDTGETKF